MNNVIVGLKRFITNKNTVTIIGIFLGILVLYIGYNYKINQETKLVKMPFAKETIQPRTKITEDMIEYGMVPMARLKGSVIKDGGYIVGKYTKVNTIIPAGSLIYGDTIVEKKALPDSSLIDVPSDLIVFNLKVTMDSTYGNSIFPGNYIDIYFKAKSDDGKIMVGRVIKNIKVLAVKDSAGKHVFENEEEDRVPSTILFAVPSDMHLLLRKSTFMEELEVELIPVPTSESYKPDPGAVEISSTYITEFINSKTTYVPEDVIVPPTPEKPINPPKPEVPEKPKE